jgi:DNA-binding CsgD family transcriptional regulator
MGLLDTARNKLRQARSGVSQADVSHRLRFETDRSTANLLWFSGDADGALLLYRQLGEGPAGDAPALRTWILERQAYLGDPAEQILTQFERAVAHTDSPLLQVSAHRLRAIVDDDANSLDDAASHLAGIGAFGRAAFVGEEAATMHLRQGDRIAAAASRLQAESWTSETQSAGGAAPVPAINAGEPIAEMTLTRRETQVWTHAGAGLSNQQIAAELFLSVRTIESHLYQARLKLGKNPRV